MIEKRYSDEIRRWKWKKLQLAVTCWTNAKSG